MILVSGANGQLGRCFQRLAAEFPQWPFFFAGSSDLDIGDARAVERFFRKNKVKWVINCAAYTAVDKAESEPEQAARVNDKGVGHLARACARSGAFMIHFSTDYVYHTRQNTPFAESDPVSPKSVYARTKLAGERRALRAHPQGVMVLRTSWVYAAEGHNFVQTMLRLGKTRDSIRVVADQIGSPTYAPDLAAAVLEIIRQVEAGECPQETLSGIWHYSNEGVASWYDFAHAIFEIAKIPCRVEPIKTEEYPTPAQRPPFSVLDKSKIKNTFHLQIPHWRQSLIRCIDEIGDWRL